MGVTDFFKKHTSHKTPLFVAGVVFVGVPMLMTLDAGVENLAKMGNVDAYAWNRVFIKTAATGLSSLGGFMNTTYKEWKEDERRRLSPIPTPTTLLFLLCFAYFAFFF